MTIRQPHEIFSSTQPAAFPLGFTETPITAVQERLPAACWMCRDNRWGSCSIKHCVIWQPVEKVLLKVASSILFPFFCIWYWRCIDVISILAYLCVWAAFTVSFRWHERVNEAHLQFSRLLLWWSKLEKKISCAKECMKISSAATAAVQFCFLLSRSKKKERNGDDTPVWR